MFCFFDKMLIGMKTRAKVWAEEFKAESGVSSFVATVLLILIVLLLGVLFWNLFKSYFTETLWPKITGAALPE